MIPFEFSCISCPIRIIRIGFKVDSQGHISATSRSERKKNIEIF